VSPEAPRQYRVALVGCGRIAQTHFDALATVPGLRLTGVCDILPDRARAAGEGQGVPHFTSYEKMLAEAPSDLVAICTPSGMHPQHGIMAARAGIWCRRATTRACGCSW
jgi:UDP-N-acetyl-2-amino-2-deoxyglucuronate dehydrogenase